MEQENCGCTPKNCTLIKEAPELRPFTYSFCGAGKDGDYFCIHINKFFLDNYLGVTTKYPVSLNGNAEIVIPHLYNFVKYPVKVAKIIIESTDPEQFNTDLLFMEVNHAGQFTTQAVNLGDTKNSTSKNPLIRTLAVDLVMKPTTHIVLLVPELATTLLTIVPAAYSTL